MDRDRQFKSRGLGIAHKLRMQLQADCLFLMGAAPLMSEREDQTSASLEGVVITHHLMYQQENGVEACFRLLIANFHPLNES